MNLKRPTEGLREYRERRFLCRFLDAGNNEGLGTDRTIDAAAGRYQLAGVKLTPPDKGRIAVVDPLLTSLAAAFKTAFERLSGSKRIWADARSVIFTFTRLSLPPSLGCLDDAIGQEPKFL